ncbi:MAG: serine/threonine protein kinase [Planctomycetota bacterium]|jgi:serine/threonine-protein kinase
MNGDFDKEQGGFINDAEFEATLLEGVDSELEESETKVVEIEEPQKKSGLKKPSSKSEAPLRSRPSWAGKILGHFKLLRLIGEGKMGRVIQAEDINLKRIVAIKVLNKRIPGIADQDRVNQFLREARAASQIEHPNVVRIFEINHHMGWWYIAMELLEENLRKIVDAAGPLSPMRASAFIADAATGLGIAHEFGIIHRDIKPTNLMLNRHGRCKLTDFGLVRLDDPDDPFDFTDKAVGSPHFIAPEMIERREQSPAIDIYSLGATLYYALTGNPPFMGTKMKDILKKHLISPPPDVRELVPDCPATLASVIKKSMSKDPSARPSAANFSAALRAETITWQGDISGLMPGSIDLLPLIESTGLNARMLTADKAAEVSPVPEKESPKKLWNFSFSAVALIVVVLSVFFFGARAWQHKTRARRLIALAELSKQFPEAAPTYGVLPIGSVPKQANLAADSIPKFSWKGKVDTTDIKFVASRQGRYFYPVDSTEAELITFVNFMSYKNEREAVSDGKQPAP